jgi:hypothetical protein
LGRDHGNVLASRESGYQCHWSGKVSIHSGEITGSRNGPAVASLRGIPASFGPCRWRQRQASRPRSDQQP